MPFLCEVLVVGATTWYEGSYKAFGLISIIVPNKNDSAEDRVVGLLLLSPY